MKRTIWVVGLACMVTLVLSSCGGGGGAANQGNQSPNNWDQMNWNEGQWQ